MGIKPNQSITVATSLRGIAAARTHRNDVEPSPTPYRLIQVAEPRWLKAHLGPARFCDLLRTCRARQTKLLATSYASCFALTENTGTA